MVACPECGSEDIGKHTVRKNKSGDKVVYRCRWCKRIFVEDLLFSRMRFNRQVIIIALNLFNEGFNYGKIQKYMQRKKHFDVERSTIMRWINHFSKL